MARAEKRGCRDTARLVGFVVPLLVLLWIVHMGYRLTTDAKDIDTGGSEGSYIALVFGVFTVVFGLIYFVVGLTIIAELALDLLDWLNKDDDTEAISNNQGKQYMNLYSIVSLITPLYATLLKGSHNILSKQTWQKCEIIKHSELQYFC